MSQENPYVENVVWYQEHGRRKAWIHRIHNGHDYVFQYEIYETILGMKRLLQKESKRTLPLAKKSVFDFFGI